MDFWRGGIYHLEYGRIHQPNIDGAWRSGIASSANNANYINSYTANSSGNAHVYPQGNNHYRGFGIHVRCATDVVPLSSHIASLDPNQYYLLLDGCEKIAGSNIFCSFIHPPIGIDDAIIETAASEGIMPTPPKIQESTNYLIMLHYIFGGVGDIRLILASQEG